MKTFVIVGGSKGIGKSITKNLLPNNKVINLSRSNPDFTDKNLTSHNFDALTQEIPLIEIDPFSTINLLFLLNFFSK